MIRTIDSNFFMIFDLFVGEIEKHEVEVATFEWRKIRRIENVVRIEFYDCACYARVDFFNLFFRETICFQQ